MSTDPPADLDVFVMTEDIPTCPDCGARTEWDDLPNGRQKHKCLRCGKEFLMAPVEEDEPDVVTFTVTYYSMLVTEDFMAEQLLELEGVEDVLTNAAVTPRPPADDQAYGCLVCTYSTPDWEDLQRHHWTHSDEEWKGVGG